MNQSEILGARVRSAAEFEAIHKLHEIARMECGDENSDSGDHLMGKCACFRPPDYKIQS